MSSKASARDNALFSSLITVLKAAAAGVMVSAALLLLFSFVLSKKDIPLLLINPFSALLLALASFIAGYLAAKQLRKKGMAAGACCGALIFAFVALLSFLNSFSVGAAALVKLAVSVTGGAIGGVLGVNSKRSRK